MIWIGDGIGWFADWTNVGILRDGDRVALIDPASGTIGDLLAAEGIRHVDLLLATHYHRDGATGLARTWAPSAARLVPEAERHLFTDLDRFWADPARRLHRYQFRPDTAALPRPIVVDRGLRPGDALALGKLAITAVATPGQTDGAMSYVVVSGARRIAFVGDLLYGSGQLWELWNLQSPPPGDPVGSHDYHGFCGRLRQVIESLDRLLRDEAPDLLIPSHGPPVTDPPAAVATLRQRADALLTNYYGTSALRYFFPDWVARQAGRTWNELPGRTVARPPWLRVGPRTTRSIISPSGRALVVDCFTPEVAAEIAGWTETGEVAGVDAIWISHYHDDHVGGVAALTEQTGCPVWAHRRLLDVLQNPEAYRMPCLDPTRIAVQRVLEEGEPVDWEGFTLTAYHFPGQTLLHSALLVERDGYRLLIAGDSFTPGGFDDYCLYNRNPLGTGRGYERCLDLLEQLHPDALVNMHVPEPFSFPEAWLAEARAALRQRARLLTDLLPWPSPNEGIDPNWVHLAPYFQRIAAGGSGALALAVTNYRDQPLQVRAALDLPDGWSGDGQTELLLAPSEEGAVALSFSSPRSAPVGQVVIMAHLWLDDAALGPWAEALVDVAR